MLHLHTFTSSHSDEISELILYSEVMKCYISCTREGGTEGSEEKVGCDGSVSRFWPTFASLLPFKRNLKGFVGLRQSFSNH